jgi:hypothetical protein
VTSVGGGNDEKTVIANSFGRKNTKTVAAQSRKGRASPNYTSSGGDFLSLYAEKIGKLAQEFRNKVVRIRQSRDICMSPPKI